MLQRRLHGLLIQAAVTRREDEGMEAAAAAREAEARAGGRGAAVRAERVRVLTRVFRVTVGVDAKDLLLCLSE